MLCRAIWTWHTIADELNYSFETEEYYQTPIKVEE